MSARRGSNKGPLRLIVRLVRTGHDSGAIADLVELDCGHQVRSNATYRARCWRCRRLEEEGNA